MKSELVFYKSLSILFLSLFILGLFGLLMGIVDNTGFIISLTAFFIGIFFLYIYVCVKNNYKKAIKIIMAFLFVLIMGSIFWSIYYLKDISTFIVNDLMSNKNILGLFFLILSIALISYVYRKKRK